MNREEKKMLKERLKFVDTKTIIVNLLKEDKKTYLSLDRLQNLLEFIYEELQKRKMLDGYRISFNINFGAIERTVLYNRHIFGLDMDGENIYLKEDQSIDELVSQYQVDETIEKIIKNFAEAA